MDLLVSFTYIAAKHKALFPLPTGLGLRVRGAMPGHTEDFDALSESEVSVQYSCEMRERA